MMVNKTFIFYPVIPIIIYFIPSPTKLFLAVETTRPVGSAGRLARFAYGSLAHSAMEI